MAMCKDCLHFEPCNNMYKAAFGTEWHPFAICDHFKERSRFVELPCEIGADLWWINDETNSAERHENGVAGIIIKSDGVFVLDKYGYIEKPGTKFCYLSEEDAEKALEERKINNAIY